MPMAAVVQKNYGDERERPVVRKDKQRTAEGTWNEVDTVDSARLSMMSRSRQNERSKGSQTVTQ